MLLESPVWLHRPFATTDEGFAQAQGASEVSLVWFREDPSFNDVLREYIREGDGSTASIFDAEGCLMSRGVSNPWGFVLLV